MTCTENWNGVTPVVLLVALLFGVGAWFDARRARDPVSRKSAWIAAGFAMFFAALFLILPLLGGTSTLTIADGRVTIGSDRSSMTFARGEIITMRERFAKSGDSLVLYSVDGQTHSLSFCLGHVSDVAKALGMRQVTPEIRPREWVYDQR